MPELLNCAHARAMFAGHTHTLPEVIMEVENHGRTSPAFVFRISGSCDETLFRCRLRHLVVTSMDGFREWFQGLKYLDEAI